MPLGAARHPPSLQNDLPPTLVKSELLIVGTCSGPIEGIRFVCDYQMVTDGWLRSLLTILPIALMSDASFLSAAGTASRHEKKLPAKTIRVCRTVGSQVGRATVWAQT